MTTLMLDQQFENLFARASKSPYFDLERALCLTMESHMQQQLSIPLQENGRLFSLVKVFAWPSEELCACIRKADTDHLYVFDAAQKNLSKIESILPMLQSVNERDRIVILNDWIAQQITRNDLEQIIFARSQDSDEDLAEEIRLHALVNVRSQQNNVSENFAVRVLTS